MNGKSSFFLLLFLLLIITESFSAPMWGETMFVKQPDGSEVEVKVYGDEFYRRYEGLDGYTLVQDKKTKWLCYADLSANGDEFISTGEKYTIKNKENASKKSVKIMNSNRQLKKRS